MINNSSTIYDSNKQRAYKILKGNDAIRKWNDKESRGILSWNNEKE